MPLYEYQCDACSHRFEVIQKFSDAPIDTCPKCGGTVAKLISSPAIQFKGSGFYLTDYGRGGSSGARGGSSEGGDSKGGDSKSGDAKGGDSKGGEKSGDSGKSDTKSGGASEKKTETASAGKSDAKPSGSASKD